MRRPLIVFILSHLLVHRVDSTRKCCDEDVNLNSTTICDNNKGVGLDCTGKRILTDKFVMIKTKLDTVEVLLVFLENENEDHSYLLVKEPSFCVGTITRYHDEAEDVAVACASKKYWHIPRMNLSEHKDFWLVRWTIFLNSSSLILLLITEFLYFYLVMLRDVYGKICFHFSLTWCLFHARLLYKIFVLFFEVKDWGHDFCLTGLYVEAFILLTMFTWSFILSYHIWMQSKGRNEANDNTRFMYYAIFGYGIPFLIIFICNVHGHVKHYIEEEELGFSCWTHNEILGKIYIVPPSFAIVICNTFFYFASQKHLTAAAAQIRKDTAKYRKMRYRLLLNLRLFFITGIPAFMGLLFIFFIMGKNILKFDYDRKTIEIINKIFGIIGLIICSEGIFIFLVLVAFRKSVHKGIVRSGLIPCITSNYDWRMIEDPETDHEDPQNENNENQNLFTGSNSIQRAPIEMNNNV